MYAPDRANSRRPQGLPFTFPPPRACPRRKTFSYERHTRAFHAHFCAQSKSSRWPRCALPAALLSGSSRKIEARPFRAARLPLKYQLCRASPSRNDQMIVPRLCVADVSVHPPPQTAPCSFGFGTNAPNGQILNKSAEMIKKTAIEPLCSRFGHGDSAVYCALSRGNL